MRRRAMGTTILVGPLHSRALSTFVSIASTGQHPYANMLLPLTSLLVIGGAILGYVLQGMLGLEVGVTLGIVSGPIISLFSRILPSDRVVWLENRRRWVGLDRALPPEQLAQLEIAAQDWERIDNAMQSDAWRIQSDLGQRVAAAAEKLMATLIDRTLANQPTDEAAILRSLAVCVDTVTGAMGAYERPRFDSNQVSVGTGLAPVADLEDLLRSIESPR